MTIVLVLAACAATIIAYIVLVRRALRRDEARRHAEAARQYRRWLDRRDEEGDPYAEIDRGVKPWNRPTYTPTERSRSGVVTTRPSDPLRRVGR